jgi:metallo-beta-lactamase family protein
MSTTLSFLGACDTVTGSRFLIEGSVENRVLVDCGLFQGQRDVRRRNWLPLGAQPSRVDAVVLSHAHLDHTGYLPVLVRDGFAGEAFATTDTCALTDVVLHDSAHLQEEDAAYALSHHLSKHDPPQPLYDTAQAETAIDRLHGLAFDQPVQLGTDSSVILRRAGHILGSATVQLDLDDRTLSFTGDLGRESHPLLLQPARRCHSDVLVVESTYGGRSHSRDETSRLGDVIRETVSHRGSVLIPAFAVDRTEIVLHLLKQLREDGAIPDVPVFVDSPMALRALEVYQRAFDQHAADVRPNLGPDPLGLEHVRLASTVEESMRLNAPAQPCIIVSASGMASGGRVVHHLAHLAADARNTIVVVGYQAIGTRGYDLVHGSPTIKALGRYFRVRARVESFDGLSVHADEDEMLAWLGAGEGQPEVVYVVHGDEAARSSLAERITRELGWLAVLPRHGEVVRVD